MDKIAQESDGQYIDFIVCICGGRGQDTRGIGTTLSRAILKLRLLDLEFSPLQFANYTFSLFLLSGMKYPQRI